MSQNETVAVLSDLGEFELLKRVVIPSFSSSGLRTPLGDDCAFVAVEQSTTLAITSDAAPRPLVFALGVTSYWSWGWYTVLINASDLAAAGARPLAFTSSVEAPADMLLSDFEEFFHGMADACRELRISNAGGNIRMASKLASHGTAIGAVTGEGALLTRGGCRPNDLLVAIGPCGRFIATYLRARRIGWDALNEAERQIMLAPRPQLESMQILQRAGVLSAASDNSDGVLGAVQNIIAASQCGAELILDDVAVPTFVVEVAHENDLDPWNLFFFWGDWQVVASVRSDREDAFRSLVAANGIDVTALGRAVAGASKITGVIEGERLPIRLVRNENFTPESYNADASVHVERMLATKLFLTSDDYYHQ